MLVRVDEFNRAIEDVIEPTAHLCAPRVIDVDLTRSSIFLIQTEQPLMRDLGARQRRPKNGPER